MIALSMAALYQQPNSRPPESMTQVQNTSILRSLQRLGPCLPFICLHFSCAKYTRTHFTKRSSFLSKAGLREDGLRLLITHKFSCHTPCDVCSRVVLLVKKKYLQLRDRHYLRIANSLLCMFAMLKHFGCVFQERLYLHTANKSVSGRFCHGLKHRGGNKPHIHVSDNRLMDANVCWAFPTPPTWLLRLTKI